MIGGGGERFILHRIIVRSENERSNCRVPLFSLEGRVRLELEFALREIMTRECFAFFFYVFFFSWKRNERGRVIAAEQRQRKSPLHPTDLSLSL